MASFGTDCREQEFTLRKEAVFLNHGSYGTVPRRVLQAQRALQEETEDHPDAWFRFKNSEYWCRSLRCAAEFVGSRVENLSFVVNATAGVNAVLRSIDFKENDIILVHPWTYKAVMSANQYVCDRFGAELKSLDVKYPVTSKADLLEVYRDALDSTAQVKLVVLDHITSCTAVLFPVKDIVELCRSRGVLVLIDGAHAPGQVPLNLEELNADFFVGNFHKWVFAPRGCAVLWVHPDHHVTMRGPITSHYYKFPNFQYELYLQGTRDNTAYHASFHGIEFYRDMGGYDAIHAYNTDLLSRAIQHLSELWGTLAAPVAPECRAPFMQSILCPDMKAYPKSATGAAALMLDLYEKDGIQTATIFIEGELWFRLSVQIYNTIADYERLGLAVMNRKEVDPSQVELDNPLIDAGTQARKLIFTQ